MEKQFSRNRKNLIVSYNNVENKIILGFVSGATSEGKIYDYYVLDIKETAVLIDVILAIKELFESVTIDLESSYEENYIRPKRIKLPASEEELYYEYLKELAPVVVSLPNTSDDMDIQEKVFNACKEFMEALAYDSTVSDVDIDFSPFLQIDFKRTNKAPEEEIKELYAEGKLALDQKVAKPNSKSSTRIPEAAGKIIAALELVNEAAIRLGTILILKVKTDDKFVISIKTISSPFISTLETHPRLMKHPATVLDLITIPVKQVPVKSWRKP